MKERNYLIPAHAIPETRVAQLTQKLATVREQMQQLDELGERTRQAPGQQLSLIVGEECVSMASRGLL